MPKPVAYLGSGPVRPHGTCRRKGTDGENTPCRKASWQALGLSLGCHLGIALLLAVIFPYGGRLSHEAYQAVPLDEPARWVVVAPRWLVQSSALSGSDKESQTLAAKTGPWQTSDNKADDSLPVTVGRLDGFTELTSAAPLPQLPLSTEHHDEKAAGLPVIDVSQPRLHRHFGLSADAVAALVQQDRQQLASEQPVGEPATLRLFSLPPATARSFVFVLDRSASTGPGALNVLAAARRELSKAIATLGEEQRVAVIAYNDRLAYLGSGRLEPVTKELCKKVDDFLQGIVAFGPTDHVLALHAALDLRGEVMFFLTDGDDPQLTIRQLDEIAHRAREAGTRIFCVQFGQGSEPSPSFLPELASRTGGEYGYVDAAQ